MHPILEELFMKPVGWMTLGGLGFIVLIGVYLWLFVRKRMRQEGDG
jgi:LPXTG-motif cell wall-anchored protein